MKAANYKSNNNYRNMNILSTYDSEVIAGEGGKH